MLSLGDIKSSKCSLTKNLISDQTPAGTTKMSGSPVFDVTYGYGISTATTIVVACCIGGFNDQQITGVMRYRAPTAAGSEYMGVFARMASFDAAGSQNYYFARQNAGVFKLSYCLAGAFTNLSTVAYALAADVDATIVLKCVGSAISASINSSGLGLQTLSANDSHVTTGGLMGFRTFSQVGYCSSFTCAEQ